MDNAVTRARCPGGEPAQTRPIADTVGSILPCARCGARACGVCGGAAPPNLPRLAALATIANVSRGQTFIHEGAPSEHFCILIQGSAKLYKLLPDGRRQIVGFGYAGSFLGVSAPEHYAFSAEAIEPIRMCRLSRRGLLRLLSDSDAMKQRLLEVAVNKLVLAQEHMVLLGRKTTIERVASFLLFQSKRPQPRGVLPPRIHLPMSRGDISDYLGVTVETVCRCLTKLAKSGVIAIPNIHEVVILDLSHLESLAHGAC
jgi:CRP/FNR family transcriptional regulator